MIPLVILIGILLQACSVSSLLTVRPMIITSSTMMMLPVTKCKVKQHRRIAIQEKIFRLYENINNNENDNISKIESNDGTEIVKQRSKRELSSIGFSYVEDGVYTNLVDEIEAMGGDISFVSTATTSTGIVEDDTINTTTATTKWEWDGINEDDAYFDE